MLLVPPVCGRGTTRVQFGLSRSTANSISARSARTKFSLFLVIGFPTLECAPREPALGSSSYRKQAVPNCSGLSGQGIFSTVIQSAYSLGVEPFLVHLKKGLPERVSRDLLNCVADCVGRCGKSHILHCSQRPRSLPAGEQLGSGAIVEKGHFTLQSACRLQADEIHHHEMKSSRTSGVTSSIS